MGKRNGYAKDSLKTFKGGTKMDFSIDKMNTSDCTQVLEIYLSGIKTGIATFQKYLPSWEEWDKSYHASCRLVARSGDTILGWVALNPYSNKCTYAGVADVSIYVNEADKGQGIGKALLTEIIQQSERNGFWTLQSGIIKENIPSIELYRKCGFREVGIRERLGEMDNGKWYDVVLMERRSKEIGAR